MARPSVVAGVPMAVVLAAVLSGCVGYAVPDDVATYQPDGPGGAAAALSGTLVREDGCTYDPGSEPDIDVPDACDDSVDLFQVN